MLVRECGVGEQKKLEQEEPNKTFTGAGVRVTGDWKGNWARQLRRSDRVKESRESYNVVCVQRKEGKGHMNWIQSCATTGNARCREGLRDGRLRQGGVRKQVTFSDYSKRSL